MSLIVTKGLGALPSTNGDGGGGAPLPTGPRIAALTAIWLGDRALRAADETPVLFSLDAREPDGSWIDLSAVSYNLIAALIPASAAPPVSGDAAWQAIAVQLLADEFVPRNVATVIVGANESTPPMAGLEYALYIRLTRVVNSAIDQVITVLVGRVTPR